MFFSFLRISGAAVYRLASSSASVVFPFGTSGTYLLPTTDPLHASHVLHESTLPFPRARNL